MPKRRKTGCHVRKSHFTIETGFGGSIGDSSSQASQSLSDGDGQGFPSPRRKRRSGTSPRRTPVACDAAAKAFMPLQQSRREKSVPPDVSRQTAADVLARIDRDDSTAVAALEAVWQRALIAIVSSPDVFPPFVRCEVQLRRELLKLREFYAELLREAFGRDFSPPRESFNRWLLELVNRGDSRSFGVAAADVATSRRSSLQRGSSSCVDDDGECTVLGRGSRLNLEQASLSSSGLFREILEDVPMKVSHVFPSDIAGQLERLRKFADAAATWASERCPDDRDLRDACVEVIASSDLSASGFGTSEGPRDGAKQQQQQLAVAAAAAATKLAELRRCVALAVMRTDGPRVAAIVRRLEVAAHAAFDAVLAARHKLLASGVADASVDVHIDDRGCTTLVASDDIGDIAGASDDVRASCVVSIGTPCIEQLSQLLQLSLARLRFGGSSRSSSDGADDCSVGDGFCTTAEAVRRFIGENDVGRGGFWRLVFCVLCRLAAFCGPGKGEGQGLHAAVPPGVLRCVAQHLGLTVQAAPTECCASPLNCRAVAARPPGLFGSLFLDLDVFFGSCGSFLGDNFNVRSGLFEVNPPFDLSVMHHCVAKILRLLHEAEEADESLAFAVFLPEWQTPWLLYKEGLIEDEALPPAPPRENYHHSGNCGGAGGDSGSTALGESVAVTMGTSVSRSVSTDDGCARGRDGAATARSLTNTVIKGSFSPLAALLDSSFCRGSLMVRQQQHSYVHGLNYLRSKSGSRLMRAIGKSRCVVLQTSCRFQQTPPTESMWRDLRQAWRRASN
eukprot:TRINITY_DN74580_c0_g1_i1.p1 TRINITY_DN74580_c0_g1~~TRINITY_DN74580_c0_g1_i1.p1  ORF type:complete len:790 (+),score=163.96 TRINITY_DN74580_c0_g1_i1:145-2514(+)